MWNGCRRLSTVVDASTTVDKASTRTRSRLHTAQVGGAVDDPDVGEGLRIVTDQTPRDGVVLLGEEPQVTAERQEPLEQGYRIVDPPDQGQVVDQPERAGKEGALCPGHAVDPGRRL